MKKRLFLAFAAAFLVVGVLSPSDRTIDASRVDTFRGTPSNGCVNTHTLASGVPLTGIAQVSIFFHIRTEGQTVAGGRWETSAGGLGATRFIQSDFDGWVPADVPPLTGWTVNIPRGASGTAAFVVRETANYPGCFRIDSVVVSRTPYNDPPPPPATGTPPPTPPHTGEIELPSPTPTPSSVPTAPPCAMDYVGIADCVPPDGYCFGFGPPNPGEPWPMYECAGASPSPTPAPSPSCSSEATVVLHNTFDDADYTYRRIDVCAQTVSLTTLGSGKVGEMTDGGFTFDGAEVAAYWLWNDAHITFTSPGCNMRVGMARDEFVAGDESVLQIVNVQDEEKEGLIMESTGGSASDTYKFFGSSCDTGASTVGMSSAVIWIGPVWPGPAGWTPSDGSDVTPSPSPTASASSSPSSSPSYNPPTPPVGYPSPDSNGDPGPVPSIGPAVPDVDGFDGVMLHLQSKAPFNYVIQVTTALEDAAGEAAGGAGPAGGTYGCFVLPRWTPEGMAETEACVPLQDMANDAAPMRGALLAMLIIGVGVGILKWTMRATGGGS